MIKRGSSKRGVSPIIATVLLIVLVIIIAFLIFWWAKRIVGEACQKQEKAAELKCPEIILEATKSGTSLYLSNNGNVPIYKTEVKINADGSKSSEVIEVNLGPGQANSWEITAIDGATDVSVVPILKGSKKTSLCEHTCDKVEIEVLEAE